MARRFERVFLGIGSNLGDRSSYLNAARELIENLPRTHFLRASTAIETEPIGGPPQGKFLNAVWEVKTRLSPKELMNELLEIEKRLGRNRGERNIPREIDMDILFFGNEIIEEEELTIPHARLHERAFVLAPFCELEPEWIHPKLKKSVRELLQELEKVPS
ncbi:MAG: 2-amino-4-hydroxy-6-hydroxymethyldihydropteridine diphosphokinase [Candidatus Omnitrophica bacterium]|nr:2-amino-4-hydroxy-6-hydroxymethyldihydropteridine diphosphokinase [Candidatus Omnitrophota bacterium]